MREEIMAIKLWEPDQKRKENTKLWAFKKQVEGKTGHVFNNYDDIWSWSVEKPEAFWSEAINFCQLNYEGPTEPALENGDDLLKARFFPNMKLNYAENLLAHEASGEAIVFYNELNERRSLSWQELRDQVSRFQQALVAHGIKEGDRVAGFMPNMPETIIAMLATSSLGAIWSSCSPDFGVQGVLDRFGQIEPKLLVACDGYSYNGKAISCLPVLEQVSQKLSSLKTIVVVPFGFQKGEQLQSPIGTSYQDFLGPFQAGDIQYIKVPFQAPLFIMFSSGTTGMPKCIVHGVGGTILQHLKEHQLQSDILPQDRLFYYTTCGWMMWNWMVSALASQATLVLYDGNPFYPDSDRLSQLCADEQFTHFGSSAKYFDSCAKADVCPANSQDFSHLRVILSTGSPLAAEGFDYIYASWKKDVCLSSVAGGTDIIACFFGGNPIGPVYRGQCQKRELGLNVQTFNDDGAPVEGEAGELVCIAPQPSQPIGFWNDPQNERYKKAYFDRWPNVWHHGDLVELTAEGGAVFFGRSDTTLNPGGVRIGTAEIYRLVEPFPEVLEALVIGQDYEGDMRIVLFVKLREGTDLTPQLIDQMKQTIRKNATPRHVPAVILACPDLPKTRSGKISEIAVRDIVHGRSVKNKEALLNPESLNFFKNLSGLT
jgi:acetoacetyl-CoA synthetase